MTSLREVVPAALAGERVDRAVSLLTELSRTTASELVASGAVRVGGRTVGRSHRLAEGDVLEVDLPGAAQPPQPDPGVVVEVVHEDQWLAVIDKPAGLVVHPGAGNRSGTLVNGLLARYPDLARVGEPDRPGVVHRLDKGTSGLLVVALRPEAHQALVAMMAERRVDRRYLSLVAGRVEAPEGVIDAPIGRSARQPTRMAVSGSGRSARTRYRVLERLDGPPPRTLLECRLETGRTHQIRVHLAAIGHPVVGDDRYGSRSHSAGERPFLHAHQLGLVHPSTGAAMSWTSPLPPDLQAALDASRSSRG
ncbi:MAG TPA: RluA family pseudouridine synthase [Acidimicrobiales bacterium]|nr:RluA family pseudouridine synthase [Acidimicrobiales bacterium]